MVRFEFFTYFADVIKVAVNVIGGCVDNEHCTCVISAYLGF